MNKNSLIIRIYSLLEISVAVGLLLLIMAAVFQFLSASTNAINKTDSKREVFENARIALDMISRDLESAYYGNGSAPFWHHTKMKNGEWGPYSNELLAFVADAPILPNEECTDKRAEIKYQLNYETDLSSPDAGWIGRSISGNMLSDDTTDSDWNWEKNFTVGYKTQTDGKNIPYAAFTADSSSSGAYQKLIPYVLDLSFVCDTDIDPDKVIEADTGVSKNYAESNSISPNEKCNPTQFPSIVTIYITMMDKNSWNKWVSLEKLPDKAAADSFRVDHEQTFSRTVYLEDRGQS